MFAFGQTEPTKVYDITFWTVRENANLNNFPPDPVWDVKFETVRVEGDFGMLISVDNNCVQVYDGPKLRTTICNSTESRCPKRFVPKDKIKLTKIK